MTSCEICEIVIGSTPKYTVFRDWVWNPIPPELISSSVYPTLRKSCYIFNCNCPIGQNLGKKGITNEGWQFTEYDSNIDCIHLLSMLAIFEVHRLKELKQYNTINYKRLNRLASSREWNRNKMHQIFNASYWKTGCEFIEISDTNNSPNYSVQLYDNNWSCTCKGFYYHTNCKHIKRVKRSEEHKFYRRELGISLAQLALGIS